MLTACYSSLHSRCGLTGKHKLSYVKFLEAFQDGRLSSYGRAGLGTPTTKRTNQVIFESHMTLSPEHAIGKLRGKISENHDVMKRVRVQLG